MGCLTIINHLNDPYPTASEKQQLAKMLGLSQVQVKTWFANVRRRSKNTDEFQRRCKNHWSKPMAECSSIMSLPSSPLPLPYPSNHNLHLCLGKNICHTWRTTDRLEGRTRITCSHSLMGSIAKRGITSIHTTTTSTRSATT